MEALKDYSEKLIFLLSNSKSNKVFYGKKKNEFSSVKDNFNNKFPTKTFKKNQ